MIKWFNNVFVVVLVVWFLVGIVIVNLVKWFVIINMFWILFLVGFNVKKFIYISLRGWVVDMLISDVCWLLGVLNFKYLLYWLI